MTVTYTAEVATCRGLGVFWKLLFRWRGSIYKLLWPNLVVYFLCYFMLSALYRFILDDHQKETFEKISIYCRSHSELIPVSFVLGFYVSIVIKRWWDQYMGIPWPDNLAMFVSTLIHGNDERGRLMRRTILRYVNLCFVFTLCMMCPRVKKRFPTLEHLVEAGFLQPNEQKIFENLDQKTTHPKYWMPLVWAGSIVTRARKEGRVRDDFSMKTLIDGLCTFRGQCGGMLNYDWISIPLVYTQVVTLAVYIFFLATLMGNQFLNPTKHYTDQTVDLVFPIFTFLQFFFYMGWLKVAESLVNPFGEDDDDFEVNWLVDRNLQVSYLIVDEMHNEHPELVKDQYWDEVFPAELPYTAAAKQYQTGPPQGSTTMINIPYDEAEFLPMETVYEESELVPMDDDDEVLVDFDDIQLDIESGILKRKETHPMKILMARKASFSSKTSVQSSSVTGHMDGGSCCRTRDANEGIGRSLMGLSYSSSTMKGTSASYKQKNQLPGQHSQTALCHFGKKNSMLSILTRYFHKDDCSKGELKSNLGSNASLRSHRRGAFGRSISRVNSSRVNSRASINRENTADFQDEIFKMSDLSICSIENEANAALQKQKKRSQNSLRPAKRKVSVRLTSAENVGDSISKEDNRLQASLQSGEETPSSTVPSTPGEGEKDGMLGRRVWVTKKKSKDEGKDTVAIDSEEIINDDDYEDEEREEEEDNGIWFSRKKAQDKKKSSSNRKEESSCSPTKPYRREGTGVDNLSLVSDSSVKTSYYHGSWETLGESKGVGSVTTITSSHAAKTPLIANQAMEKEAMKDDKETKVLFDSSGQGDKWSSGSWAGSDGINAALPQLGQSLGSSALQQCSARIILPKRSDRPLKHVFEPRQTVCPAPLSPVSLVTRSRVTSKLARGIAQMAAVKQDPTSSSLEKTQDQKDIHPLNVNVTKPSENVTCTSGSVQDSKGKLAEGSSNGKTYDSLKNLNTPANVLEVFHVSEAISKNPLIPLPTSIPSQVDRVSTSTDKYTCLAPAKPPDISLSPSLSPSTSLPPFVTDQNVITPVTDLSSEISNIPTTYVSELTIPDTIRSGSVCSMVDISKRTKDVEAEIKPPIPREDLHDERCLTVAIPLQDSDTKNPDYSHIFQTHIPSSAIPVPSVSSAYSLFEDNEVKSDDETSQIEDPDLTVISKIVEDTPDDINWPSNETEVMIGRRRIGGLRDFVELEPIAENAELGKFSTSQNEYKISDDTEMKESNTDEEADESPEMSV